MTGSRCSARATVALVVVALTACGESAGTSSTQVAGSAPTTLASQSSAISPAPPPSSASSSATCTTQWTPPTPREACLRRAAFGDPADSLYRLPFPPGSGYTVLQSYCTEDGSHETQLAYDFLMPLGLAVTASRGGVVREVVENVPDDANTSRLNYLLIEHEDGTVAFYAHIHEDGALVAVGAAVSAGDPIALSGASGRTHPSGVLHFGVYRSWPPRDEHDVAVDFSNAEGILDTRGGLREGAFYRALP